MLVSSAWLVMATFLVAECKVYWQFLLCQGFAIGVSSHRTLQYTSSYSANSIFLQLGCGIIFNPTLGVIPHWFKKKKGIALGLVAFGSSIGGTVFPIAVRNLIQSVG